MTASDQIDLAQNLIAQVIEAHLHRLQMEGSSRVHALYMGGDDTFFDDSPGGLTTLIALADVARAFFHDSTSIDELKSILSQHDLTGLSCEAMTDQALSTIHKIERITNHKITDDEEA